ncbi:MAG: hypothetical protein WAO02_14825 [Verrucomicrobiia bacterium]
MKQPTLFDQLKPRSLEVAGPDLPGIVADLKRRGGHISGMVRVSTSGWRLTIEWPDTPTLCREN